MHRPKVRTLYSKNVLPVGLPVRGEGPLSAVFSDGTENGSTTEEAINTPN